MTKEQEIMIFLNKRVFDPVLLPTSKASSWVRGAVANTRIRMSDLSAKEMIGFLNNSVAGTEASIRLARQMAEEGFTRFEDVKDEFNTRFNEEWLRA